MKEESIQQVKQRFGIIGNDATLNRAIDVAMQVAPTDLSVLITGESGVGKENFPQIIHQNSHRKHGTYIAVNCGAIPEGTIDSELFGHEKGSFTGALADRKGYFEVADGGTIFLDEVGELPIPTQARLLRVLESGEFIKVGSSKVLKTNVRIVAATNVNLVDAVAHNRFREDLYYRLNTVPIVIPPLRDRGDDILLLFRKFASDAAEKYRVPPIRLEDDARQLLLTYRWPGNVRELKNVTERLSILEPERTINADRLRPYLPNIEATHLPVPVGRPQEDGKLFSSEREILYQVLFDMKKDMAEMKNLIAGIMRGEVPVAQPKAHGDYTPAEVHTSNAHPTTLAGRDDYRNVLSSPSGYAPVEDVVEIPATPHATGHHAEVSDFEEQPLSLEEAERSLIQAALIRHDGRRRRAAQDLKISERTLYRKIKEYGLEE